jgi:hypothetical protein
MDRANFKGKAKKLWEGAEYVGANPNSTSTVVGNATRADVSLVSDARKLVRRAAGKNANFDKMPSVKSRGVPRMLFKALELIGDDPNASSADGIWYPFTTRIGSHLEQAVAPLLSWHRKQ